MNEKPPMNEAQVNAVLSALENQRNAALNALANTEASLAMANARIAELQKQIPQKKVQTVEPEKAAA